VNGEDHLVHFSFPWQALSDLCPVYKAEKDNANALRMRRKAHSLIMKAWQEKLADFAVCITAGMLLATGGMMMSIGHQQVKITTQVESITEKLDALTENMKTLDVRVRELEIQR
jgi:hypothetical protein